MSDNFLLSMVDMGLNLQGDGIRDEIETEVSKVIKQLADKYAPYFDVKWKVISDGTNNTPTVIKNRQIVVDTYVQVPALSSEFIKVNVTFTISSTPDLPGTKH
jgi:hypothetical protein